MTNITTELKDSKEKILKNLTTGKEAIKQVLLITNGEADKDLIIARALGANELVIEEAKLAKKFELEQLDGRYAGNVFSLVQIKNLARKYNMRFLQRQYYKGELPVELIGKLKEFNQKTGVELSKGNIDLQFYMLAPEKQFVLKQVELVDTVHKTVWTDPAMFYKIDEDHYRLIHQWGTDFNIFNWLSGLKWKSVASDLLFTMIIWTVISLGIVYLVKYFELLSDFQCMIICLMGPILAAAWVLWDVDKEFNNQKYHEKKWNSPIIIKGRKTVTITDYKSRFGGQTTHTTTSVTHH